MPKPKLTQEAVAFIIQVRDDPTTITTWEDISKMVEEQFSINVSLHGVAKSYHRNKGKVDTNQTIIRVNQSSAEVVKKECKPEFQEFKKIKTRTQNQKEFVEYSDEEFLKILKGE